MKRMLFALGATSALAFATPATAANTLVADGITYTLTENSISANGLTAFFTLTISGENTVSDTEGGRTGINAFALQPPSPGTVTGGVMTSPASGWTFMPGGLGSTGCDGTGNFFCFDNTAIPPTPTTALSGPLSFNFNVTANTAGLWSNYTTAFKIDWVGTKNNYDLVSLPIPVNGVPEPATWAMMLLGFTGIGMTIRKRRTGQALAQVA